MTTEEFFAYLRNNAATSELGAKLAQILEQRATVRRLVQQTAGNRAA